MKLMLQFGKVQLQGLMRSTECSSQGVWVAKVPPTERVDEKRRLTRQEGTFINWLLGTGTPNLRRHSFDSIVIVMLFVQPV